jgi:putative ABC transport system permease protein
MIKHYFKIAIRNIKRYPAHSILNISGMAIGMACAFLLLLWVQNELSYDRFYRNTDQLFRVLHTLYLKGKTEQWALSQYPLAEALKEEYPEVIKSSRYSNFWEEFSKEDNFIGGTLATVDKDFFEMFDIKFVKGDINSALKGPYNIIITEDMAGRYFGKEDPMGKPMPVGPDRVFTVTGVIKNVPRNSHFYIDCLVSFEYFKLKSGATQADLNSWNKVFNYTFIQIGKGTNSGIFEGKIKDFVQRRIKGSNPDVINVEVFLQNVKKIHLYSRGKYNGDIVTGSITYVRLASLLAILMLTIACINFMSLSTAQSARRSKEIGLRKVAGANKRKIIFQFLGESVLLVFVAHLIAMILVELMLPAFNGLMHTQLAVNYQSLTLYLELITIVLLCGLLAGSYPAFYLSSQEPLNIMKGVINQNRGGSRFRKILVVSQFTLSFLFIISTLIIKSQVNYMQRNIGHGLNINNTLHFDFSGIAQTTLKRELSNDPNILSSTVTLQNTVYFWNPRKGFEWEGKKGEVIFNLLNADVDYVNTFQPKITRGRFFSTEFSTDNTAVVINERAAELLGFDDPVGKFISHSDLKFKIIGVVKDFNYGSLQYKIEPLLIMLPPQDEKSGICNIKFKPGTTASVVNYVRKVFKSNNLNYPLGFNYPEDDLKIMYFMEVIAGSLFVFLSFLAMFISCLGLIGLSTFMIIRRTKEIGIRKTNGAKSFEIFSMLSNEFIKLVSISFLIAGPIAWYGTNIWLQGYAYKISVSWSIYVIAWLTVMAITMLTIGFQAYRASRRNPVEALRFE